MENMKEYILNGREIFPYTGEFDFGNKKKIKEKHLTLSYLAKDISNSIYGSKKDMAEKAYEEIYRKLYMYSENDTKKRYGLIPQIKRTLGVDLKDFINRGSYQQKEDALKLIKLIYHFTKLEPKCRVIPLLEKPSLDNIQNGYYEHPFYTEIYEMKKVLDFLNAERQGKDFQEIQPVGNEEFTLNEVVFRNELLASFAEKNTDEVKKLNDKMDQMKSNIAEDHKFTFNDAFKDISNLDVLQVFSFALDRYHLKCLNEAYISSLSSLKDLTNFFDNTEYFTDNIDLKNLFKEQDQEYVVENADVHNVVDDLLEDEKPSMLIIGKKEELSEDDRQVIELVKRDAEYVLRNYEILNWEERYDRDINISEKAMHKAIWISILQMLYICRKENLAYTSDSMGDKINKRSLKEVFAKWNPKENLENRQELRATEIWHRRKFGLRLDIPIESENDHGCYAKSGQNDWLRNKGKEYLIGKLFPQLIYARNRLLKEEFDVYIHFLENYHEIQQKLCENIVYDEFTKNCNIFFEWMLEETNADICYEMDLEDDEKSEEIYAGFRRDFLENKKDTYDYFNERYPEAGKEVLEFAKKIFISKDIESMYQGIKSVLPPRCRTEYDLLQKLLLINDKTLFNKLQEWCYGYEYEAFSFLKNIFEKITLEEYSILKKYLRQKKDIEYSMIKTALLEEGADEYTELEKMFPEINKKECQLLKEGILKSNEFEFCILNKLIHRK